MSELDEVKRLHDKIVNACDGELLDIFISACYVSAIKAIATGHDCSFLQAAKHFSDWITTQLIPGQEMFERLKEDIN